MAQEVAPQPGQDAAAEALTPHQQFTAELEAAAQGLDGVAVPTVGQFDQARLLAEQLKPGGAGFHAPDGKLVPQEAAAAVELTADPQRWEMDADQEAQWRAAVGAKNFGDLPEAVLAHMRMNKVDANESGASILRRAHLEADARLALHDHLKAEEAGRQAEVAAEQTGKMHEERQRVYDQEHARAMTDAARDIEAKVNKAVANVDPSNPYLESTKAKFRADYERQAKQEAHGRASAAADAREEHINTNGGIDNLEKINFKDKVGSGNGEASAKMSDSRYVDNRTSPNHVLQRPEGVDFNVWYNADRAERAQLVADANAAAAEAVTVETENHGVGEQQSTVETNAVDANAERVAEEERRHAADKVLFAEIHDDLVSGDPDRIARAGRKWTELVYDTEHPERQDAYEAYSRARAAREANLEQRADDGEEAIAEDAAAVAADEADAGYEEAEVAEGGPASARREWSRRRGQEIVRSWLERRGAGGVVAEDAVVADEVVDDEVAEGDEGLGPDGTMIGGFIPVEDASPEGRRSRFGRIVGWYRNRRNGGGEEGAVLEGDEENNRRRRGGAALLLGAGAVIGAGIAILAAKNGVPLESIFGGPVPLPGGKSGSHHEVVQHAATHYEHLRAGGNPWDLAKAYLKSAGNKHPSNAEIRKEDASEGRRFMAAHHLGRYSWAAWSRIARDLPVGTRLRLK